MPENTRHYQFLLTCPRKKVKQWNITRNIETRITDMATTAEKAQPDEWKVPSEFL
jgi:hypothetical protein